MENNIEKKKNGVMVLVIILIIIILGLVGFIVYKELSSGTNNNNNNSNNGNNNTDNNQEDNKQNDNNAVDASDYKYTMDVYKTDDNMLCNNDKRDDICKTKAFTIKTESNGANVLTTNEKNIVLYNDNGLKIYNDKTKKIIKVDLDSNYDTYNLNVYNGEVIGVVYKNNDENSSYYDLTTKKSKFVKTYQNLGILDNNYLNGYDYKNDEAFGYLLNIKEEKVELSDRSKNTASISYDISKYNNKYFYTLSHCAGDCSLEAIYDNNKKEIYKFPVNRSNNYFMEFGYSFYEGYLYLNENNVVKKYDSDGKLISTSKKYDNFKQLIQDKIIYVKDNKLVVESLNDGSIKEIVKWSDNYNYDTYLSRYYSRNDLDKINEPDKKEGLYLVIYYQSKIGDNYGMEYCYTGSEIITYPIKQEMGGRAKPVLYLYPTEETKVKVRFAHPEYLTTTYPKYDKEWVVMASPNGDLIDSNNKYYYALYWDEVRYHEVSFDEGFYITKENAVAFLEEKLTLIGLNAKERNEFIMYWLPILENNGQSLVYFELTEERELNNKLIIEPTPDSLLRVNIHIKKVNKKINIKEQKLESFKRVGFTAVEWGGMTY